MSFPEITWSELSQTTTKNVIGHVKAMTMEPCKWHGVWSLYTVDKPVFIGKHVLSFLLGENLYQVKSMMMCVCLHGFSPAILINIFQYTNYGFPNFRSWNWELLNLPVKYCFAFMYNDLGQSSLERRNDKTYLIHWSHSTKEQLMSQCYKYPSWQTKL